jgi:hypothetical protein
MKANARGILLLVSIAASEAFQAPPPASFRRHDGLERARAQAPRAGTVALSRVRSPARMAALHPAQEMGMGSIELMYPVTAATKRLPSKSGAMSRSTLLGAAAFIVLMKAYQVGTAVAPASWTLLLHGCAGALGGLVAVLTDSTIFERSEQALNGLWQSIKFTTITKAVNSVTFAFLSETLGGLTLGVGGIALAATGTGVAATLIQGFFSKQKRDEFFHDNVAQNVLLFNTFWFTYFGICAVLPTIPATYTGVGIAGALSGVVSSAVHSVGYSFKTLREAWSDFRRSFKQGRTWRGGLQSGVLFVVYQAVYSAFA